MRNKGAIAVMTAVLALWSVSCADRDLPRGSLKDAGFSPDRLEQVSALINEAIARKEFPGAVLLVARKGKVVLHEAYGESRWVPQPKPMDRDMIFDLASLTKPVATAASVMLLVEREKSASGTG